jgi:hypothetical protein
MMAAWVQRNEELTEPLDEPQWLVKGVRQLLSVLGPAYANARADGKFGNGAVYEGVTPFGRWNHLSDFSFDPRDPNDISSWCPSSQDTARLCCVPKDMFKLRSITVEPMEATFLQQHTRTRLIAAAAECLKSVTGIPQQLWGGGPEVQRARCLKGSTDGSLATIDLKDASDRIRWETVVKVFPANIVADLERSRSSYVDVAGTRFKCHMYAGMGNATTFIVETLYFWALCTVLSLWLRDFTPVSVFGDDIVIGTKAARHPLFRHYLTRMGVVVNEEKSGTSEGPGFREACGVFAYCGYTLPLIRIQGYDATKPSELVSLCALLNQIMGETNNLIPSFLVRSAREVAASLRDEIGMPLLPLPLEREGVYLVDPSERIGPWSFRCRWNPKLQHSQVKVKVLKQRTECRCCRDLTEGEKLGVLRGQLQSTFTTETVGRRRRNPGKTCFQFPRKGADLESAWVTCWGSDGELGSLSVTQ